MAEFHAKTNIILSEINQKRVISTENIFCQKFAMEISQTNAGILCKLSFEKPENYTLPLGSCSNGTETQTSS